VRNSGKLVSVAPRKYLKHDGPQVCQNFLLRRNPIPRFNVGCSGWFYGNWRGIFYPDEMPIKKWVSHYARNFKTVELNAPFYFWPTLATVQTWRRQVGKHQFVYTVKVCELITHIKRFKGTKQLIADFSFIADLHVLGLLLKCLGARCRAAHRSSASQRVGGDAPSGRGRGSRSPRLAKSERPRAHLVGNRKQLTPPHGRP
jgi:hypothetical protein